MTQHFHNWRYLETSSYAIDKFDCACGAYRTQQIIPAHGFMGDEELTITISAKGRVTKETRTVRHRQQREQC